MGMLKPRFESPALESKAAFRKALASWFSADGKDYPWRRTHDPYAILVSEMMLQQTRIATVLGKGYYTRFLEKFPDLQSLASADDESLLKAWEGLGYYRRARMLRSTAQAVIEKYGGIFPEAEKDLLALPGLGPYTSAALLAFAFGKTSALVDGNVSRVLSRIMDDFAPIDSARSQAQHRLWAAAICDPASPRIHHYAMMELGQRICRPGLPSCEICPVARFCKCVSPEILPVKKPRAVITSVTEYAVFARDLEGRILLHLESGKRRAGLWKLPLRSAEACASLPLISEESYPITRYKVLLKTHLAGDIGAEEGDAWITPDRLASLPIAAPFRRVLLRLLGDL